LTDGRELLAAVLADPDADEPRAVYADWLDERGDPRGEFIHLQRERLGLHIDLPRRIEIEDRETELLEAHKDEWLEGLGHDDESFQLRRGFVEVASLSIAHANGGRPDEIRALAPLRHVDLFITPGEKPEAERWSWVRRVPTLELVADDEPAPQPILDDLARAGHLGGLRGLLTRGVLVRALPPVELEVLSLRYAGLGAEDVAPLLAAPGLRNLRVLDLSGNLLGDDGARAIAAAELPRLETLALAHCGIEAAGARALAGAPFARRLRALSLGESFWARLPCRPTLLDREGEIVLENVFDEWRMMDAWIPEMPPNAIGDDGVAAIAAACARLEELDLGHNAIGAEGVRALTERLPALRSLYAQSCGLDGAAAEALLARGAFVNVLGNPLPAGGIALMARQPARLWVTEISMRPCAAEDLPAVREALGGFPQLRGVSLSLQPDAVPGLARVLDALPPTLEELMIPPLDERVVAAIAACPRLANLKRLELLWVEAPKAGLLDALIASPHLPRSMTLDLPELGLGAEALARLRARFASEG
jgi:uncharacterized protein (TIGR02996 family)